MTVRTAVFIGLVGAVWGVVLNLLVMLKVQTILAFLLENPFGRALWTVPSITLVVFFGVLLVKQK